MTRHPGLTGPVPPQDVRVVLDDDSEVPVECVYTGLVDGFYHWQVVWPIGRPTRNVLIGMLPARTSVGLTLYRGEVDEAQ